MALGTPSLLALPTTVRLPPEAWEYSKGKGVSHKKADAAYSAVVALALVALARA